MRMSRVRFLSAAPFVAYPLPSTKMAQMNTIGYWRQEATIFLGAFDDPDLKDTQAIFLVRGLCHLRRTLHLDAPEHEAEIEDDYSACIALAHSVKGAAWFHQHQDIFEAHGYTPP